MTNTKARAGIFPLPFFEAPARPASASRRSWQRHSAAVAAVKAANCTLAALNTLSVSFSPNANFLNHYLNNRGARNHTTTATQNRLLSHVYRCATRTVRRRDSPESECDDPLFDRDFLSSHLRDADLDAYVSRPTTTVVPLTASRVSLPADDGAVDLLSILPPDVAARYADPGNFARAPDEPAPRAPRTRLCGSQAEWTKLVLRLRERAMVTFTTAPKVVCGVFCVPKDADKDRFIIDARPTNAALVEPPSVKLPTPDLTAALTTDGRRALYVAKVDLDNFYHRLRLPPAWCPYFALPPVRAADVGVAASSPDALVWPCCTTLPMGWSHSVLLAQLAHEHFLDTRTTLARADRVCADNDGRVDRARHQVYIDDLLLFGYDRAELARAQDAYVAAIRAVGLVVKQSKVVPPSREGVTCLGLEVNGTDHTVGVSAAKLEALRQDTLRVLDAGACTGADLARLVGRWTWACLAARPALSVLSSAYRFIECARGRRFNLWRTVAQELRTLIGLAPLLFTHTASGWFDRVVATDASSTGMGIVAAVAQRDPATVVTKDDASACATESAWRTIAAAPWRSPEHINVLELRALLTAVRWVLSHPRAVGARVLFLCDSQVVVGAVTKGRSSSQPLLRRLRALAALVLASGIRPTLTWIATDHNPADEPSRRF